jgi:hypothetical protein
VAIVEDYYCIVANMFVVAVDVLAELVDHGDCYKDIEKMLS